MSNQSMSAGQRVCLSTGLFVSDSVKQVLVKTIFVWQEFLLDESLSPIPHKFPIRCVKVNTEIVYRIRGY